ncbi:hypothetical protein IQ258_26700 [Coleofasciculus sp. LEGE 07081]|nr:hypothetical protein [Coleofasciculus sp. LEGE 07081]
MQKNQVLKYLKTTREKEINAHTPLTIAKIQPRRFKRYNYKKNIKNITRKTAEIIPAMTKNYTLIAILIKSPFI